MIVVLVVLFVVAAFALAIYALATTGTERDPASRNYVPREQRRQLDPDDPLYGMRERLAKTSEESRQTLIDWLTETGCTCQPVPGGLRIRDDCPNHGWP